MLVNWPDDININLIKGTPEYSKFINIVALHSEEFSSKHKITHVKTQLTPYGRERAKTCTGGYNGCSGEITTKTIWDEPVCLNCYNIETGQDIKIINKKPNKKIVRNIKEATNGK